MLELQACATTPSLTCYFLKYRIQHSVLSLAYFMWPGGLLMAVHSAFVFCSCVECIGFPPPTPVFHTSFCVFCFTFTNDPILILLSSCLSAVVSGGWYFRGHWLIVDLVSGGHHSQHLGAPVPSGPLCRKKGPKFPDAVCVFKPKKHYSGPVSSRNK